MCSKETTTQKRGFRVKWQTKMNFHHRSLIQSKVIKWKSDSSVSLSKVTVCVLKKTKKMYLQSCLTDTNEFSQHIFGSVQFLRWKSNCSLSKAVPVYVFKKQQPQKHGFRVIWHTANVNRQTTDKLVISTQRYLYV